MVLQAKVFAVLLKIVVMKNYTNMKNSTTILLCSDIMQHEPQHSSGKEFGYDDIFSKEIVDIAKSCDIVIANLETPITLNTTSSFPKFNANPEFLYGIQKQLGFTALSIANNHSLDQGKDGLITTFKECVNADIHPLGALGKNYLDLFGNNRKIVFHAFTDISNVEHHDNSFLNMQFGSRKIEDDEIGIVYIHTGTEYSVRATSKQKEYSKLAKELGYTACIMIHSHVIGQINFVTNDAKMVVSNGLGNFLSFQNNLSKQYGACIKITVDNITKNIVDFKFIRTETILTNNKQQVIVI